MIYIGINFPHTCKVLKNTENLAKAGTCLRKNQIFSQWKKIPHRENKSLPYFKSLWEVQPYIYSGIYRNKFPIPDISRVTGTNSIEKCRL